MLLTFLVDNNTQIGRYFLAEPGLSMLIETEGQRVLFDTGYTDAFLVNARRLGLDMLHLDWLVFSHGHFDHTWGMDQLIRHYFEAENLHQDTKRPRLLAHPAGFTQKEHRGLPDIGTLITGEKLNIQFPTTLSAEPMRLTDRLTYLGEIPRVLGFENPPPLGKRVEDGVAEDDHLADDTALAYDTGNGLVVISGCAHSGICNTIEHARQVTGVSKVIDVLGGFHLLDAPEDRLAGTADYLAALDLDALHACHCTDLAAKIHLARTCPVKEVGAGMQLEY